MLQPGPPPPDQAAAPPRPRPRPRRGAPRAAVPVHPAPRHTRARPRAGRVLAGPVRDAAGAGPQPEQLRRVRAVPDAVRARGPRQRAAVRRGAHPAGARDRDRGARAHLRQETQEKNAAIRRLRTVPAVEKDCCRF